jgi:ADP-ribosylation factor-like protein 8
MIAMGRHIEEPPTVGLNVKTMQRGNVTCKVWDIGGQERYRSEWGRYTRGCNVIVFVLDTQRPDQLPTAKKELHTLLEDPELSRWVIVRLNLLTLPFVILSRLPLLILANKIDLGSQAM